MRVRRNVECGSATTIQRPEKQFTQLGLFILGYARPHGSVSASFQIFAVKCEANSLCHGLKKIHEQFFPAGLKGAPSLPVVERYAWFRGKVPMVFAPPF